MESTPEPNLIPPKSNSSTKYYLYAAIFAILGLGMYYWYKSPPETEKPVVSNNSNSQAKKQTVLLPPKIVDNEFSDPADYNSQEETKINIPPSQVFTNAEYPGGNTAWIDYLIKNLRYPLKAQEKGIEGSVVVEFMVDEEGNIFEIKAIAGPVELRKEAEKVIYESGKWIPATQGGIPIKSNKRQPIQFRIAE